MVTGDVTAKLYSTKSVGYHWSAILPKVVILTGDNLKASKTGAGKLISNVYDGHFCLFQLTQ